jgi:putative DNA primase/helicase
MSTSPGIEDIDAALKEVRAAAEQYYARGWLLVRLRPGTKIPAHKGWLVNETKPHHFNRNYNIGLRFGPESDAIVDIDLDSPFARALVSRPVFQLDHLVEFGRSSQPAGQRGHRLVHIQYGRDEKRIFAVRGKVAAKALKERGVRQTFIEFRSSHKSQTAVPPSIIVDANGEQDPLIWTHPDGAATKIPEMTPLDAHKRVEVLAVCSLGAALCPADEPVPMLTALYGVLREAGVPDVTAQEMVREVADVAGVAQPDDSFWLCHQGESTMAFAASVGIPELARTVCQWLGLDTNDADTIVLDGSRAQIGSSESRKSQPGQISAEQLEQLLNALDPEEYATYEEHVRILLAAHHSTGGSEAGREVVVRWSARNPDYGPGRKSPDGKFWSEEVRGIWDRAKLRRKEGVYTLGTLIREICMVEGGARVVARALRPPAEEDFDDDIDPAWLEDEPQVGTPSDAESQELSGGFTGLTLTRGDRIALKPLEWCWPDRIPNGKLALLAGMADVGKTNVACDIAARITKGREWPDGNGNAKLGSVIILSAEDDPEDTLLPRIEAAGGDRSKIYILEPMVQPDRKKRGKRTFNILDDIVRLERALNEIPDVRMLIVDPIGGFMGTSKTINTFQDSDVRAALGPLKAFVEKHHIAGLIIAHFKKGGSGPAKERVMGSAAFAALSRAVWSCFEELDDDHEPTGRMFFGKAKLNVARRDVPSMVYYLEGVNLGGGVSAPRVVWEGTVSGDADALLRSQGRAAKPSSPKLAAAISFLRTELKSGPMAAAEIRKRYGEAGHAHKTIERAKEELEIHSEQVMEQGNRIWIWRLPTADEIFDEELDGHWLEDEDDDW